jgi:hypothetical protein
VEEKPAIHVKLQEAAKKKLQVTTTEAAVWTGYTRDHLGLLLRRGSVTGQKFGRDWFVSAESLYEYIKNDPHPGRKRR